MKPDKDEIKIFFSIYQDLNFNEKDEQFNLKYTDRWFSPIDRTLRRELKSRFKLDNFWFDTTNCKELIDIRINIKWLYQISSTKDSNKFISKIICTR